MTFDLTKAPFPSRPLSRTFDRIRKDCLTLLLQLGESRFDARTWRVDCRSALSITIKKLGLAQRVYTSLNGGAGGPYYCSTAIPTAA